MVQIATCPITMEVNPATDIRAQRFVVLGAAGVSEAGDGADAIGVSGFKFEKAQYDLGKGGSAIGVITNHGCRLEVVAGAAIAAGASIASDAQGRAKVVAAGDATLGVAVTASTKAGAILDMIFTPAARQG